MLNCGRIRRSLANPQAIIGLNKRRLKAVTPAKRDTHRRAVSSLVATMLLIAIAMGTSIAFYAYSAGLLGALQQPGQHGSEILVIEDIVYLSNGSAIFTVRNVGSINSRVGSIYADTNLRYSNSTGALISVGQARTFTLTNVWSIANPPTQHYFKVATLGGSVFSTYGPQHILGSLPAATTYTTTSVLTTTYSTTGQSIQTSSITIYGTSTTTSTSTTIQTSTFTTKSSSTTTTTITTSSLTTYKTTSVNWPHGTSTITTLTRVTTTSTGTGSSTTTITTTITTPATTVTITASSQQTTTVTNTVSTSQTVTTVITSTITGSITTTITPSDISGVLVIFTLLCGMLATAEVLLISASGAPRAVFQLRWLGSGLFGGMNE